MILSRKEDRPPSLHNPGGEKDLVFLTVCAPAWQPGDSYPVEELERE
jgi:hypothetical protein